MRLARFDRVEDAYLSIGMTRGSFYRQCEKPPSRTVRLAMAAVYHRTAPFGDM